MNYENVYFVQIKPPKQVTIRKMALVLRNFEEAG
jgi:hypothetical protein